MKRVCVRLPASAVHVAVAAFAAAAPLLALSIGQQSIDISCRPGTQQQTRRTLLRWSIDGTDRWTDGHQTVT